MTEAVRYRRLAAVLLLWGVVPLPWLYIIQPPFWAVAAVVGGWLLVRPRTVPRLSPLTSNLIGLVILAVVLAVGGARVGPLRPLGHLLLLVASVRAVGVRDRRTFLGLLPALFLVWLVALASSTHVSVLLYFAVSTVIWWWVGMEVTLLGVIRAPAAAGVPMVRLRHVLPAAAAAVLLAVPVFVAMPRLGSPWIAGRGGVQSVTGFSSRVRLSGVGHIRRSQEVALTMRALDGRPLRSEWSRLRATALEQVTADSWAPRRAEGPATAPGTMLWLHGERPLKATDELEITLMRPQRFLFVPTAAVAARVPLPVRRDPSGGLVVDGEGSASLTYSVWVRSDGPLPFMDAPQPRAMRPPQHPEVRNLARRIVAGRRGTAERAAAVESFLRAHYRYTLEGMHRIGPDPIKWFLLEGRRGHCEYFAGGMVVLLESLGLPARMAAGYSGGEVNPAGDELVVRQANAHTWVEAWLGPVAGWRAFDPTPAAGIPDFATGTMGAGLRVLWERVQASWDRYVLTYGLGEQLLVLEGVVAIVEGLARRLHPGPLAAVGAGVLLLWWVLATLLRRGRRASAGRRGRRPPAAWVMERLRRRLARRGVEVPGWATLRWVAAAGVRRWPGLDGELEALLARAEGELFGGRQWRAADHLKARRQWSRMRRRMRSGGDTGPSADMIACRRDDGPV